MVWHVVFRSNMCSTYLRVDFHTVLTMYSHLGTKSRPTVHSEDRDINEVIKFFDQEKLSGNFRCLIGNASKRAASATGNSEAKSEKNSTSAAHPTKMWPYHRIRS